MTTPRSLVKNLARGQIPARPLFIPLVFTLAAKLENVAVPTFLSNPTKLSNSLTAVYRHLRIDGVTAYLDPTLEAEAFGCLLSWEDGRPVIADQPGDAVLDSLFLGADQLAKMGRIPVALEVVRRLRTTLRDAALIVGLSGPLAMSQAIVTPDFGQRLATGERQAEDIFGGLAEATLQLAQLYCQAGADVILVNESPLSPLTEDAFAIWDQAMSGVWNVARFHDALPVCMVAGGWNVSPLPAGDPVLCYSAGGATTRPHALTLSPHGEQLLSQPDTACVLVTTFGEIPYETDIQQLESLVNQLRIWAYRQPGGRRYD